MVKEELIMEVSNRTGLKRVQVSAVLEGVLDTIVDTLKSGDGVFIKGFGGFVLRDAKPKTITNPKNGEVYNIPERKVVDFKKGSRLKGDING